MMGYQYYINSLQLLWQSVNRVWPRSELNSLGVVGEAGLQVSGVDVYDLFSGSYLKPGPWEPPYGDGPLSPLQ